MNSSRKIHLIISLVLYLFALAIRLYGIGAVSAQIDERHWAERAGQVVKKVHSGELTGLTTHLGHPGVPPGLIMASAQLLAEKVNHKRGISRGSAGFIEALSASRIANAVFSSAIVPMLYLGLLSLLGTSASLVAAGLFAVDPIHISLSRIAHLDAFLTVFVCGALLFYLHSLKTGRLSFKLLAGVLWGCAIATKPTAAPLVAVLLTSRILYRALVRQPEGRQTAILEWSDVWTVLLGHLVFASMYTRLWIHQSDYLLRLGIKSNVADFLYFFGVNLHAPVILVLLAVLVYLALLRACRQNERRFVNQLFLLLVVVLFLLAAFPSVFENLARFWSWAFGLSSMKHRAYGVNWEPPEGGYPVIVISRLPSLIIFGIILGFAFLLTRLLRKQENRSGAEVWVLAMLFGFILWVIPLSVSSKQTVRYAMPMIPALYVVAAWGLCQSIEWLTTVFSRVPLGRAAGAFCLLPIVIQSAITISRYPDYSLFYSSISGGLRGAITRGQNIAVAGEAEAIQALERRALAEGGERISMVLGDYALMRYIQSLIIPKADRKVTFIPFENDAYRADDVVVFPNFIPRLSEELRGQRLGEKIFSYTVDGVDVLPIYAMPMPDCREGCPFLFRKGAVGAGKLEIVGSSPNSFVSMTPGVDTAGHVMKGFASRLDAGKHRAIYTMQLGNQNGVDTAGAPDDLVARVEFSGKCHQEIYRRDLSQTEPREISLPCEFVRRFRAQVRLYWYGKVPLRLYRVTVRNGGSQQ